MRSRRILVAVLALVLVFVAAPAPADTFRVKARGDAPGNFRWRPAFQHINKGDRIVWKNPTSTSHTVTAYGDNWSKNTTIGSGDKASKRFRQKGTYRYRCTRVGHSSLSGGECEGMCGTIHVM